MRYLAVQGKKPVTHRGNKSLVRLPLLFFCLLFLSFLPGCAVIPYTPKITDQEGNVIPGSIALMEKVKIGGVDQWLLIRGKTKENPILLILHGGPGSPVGPLTAHYNSELEDYFVVVNWDQRGAGKSYSPDIPVETMTIDQFIADTHEVIELIRNRFAQEKVFLLGHSWGSYLGILVAQKYPDLVHAYIGVGQLVKATENEEISYTYVWQKAVKTGNKKAIRELQGINTPGPYYSIDPKGDWFDRLMVQREWLLKFGGCIYQETSYNKWISVFMSRPEYSVGDSLNWIKGNEFSLKAMWPEIIKRCDLFKEVPALGVPVYFFIGRHDYNTPSELAERYFHVLEAPKKEWIWFERSAHSPLFEEPQKFNELLIKKVRTEVL